MASCKKEVQERADVEIKEEILNKLNNLRVSGCTCGTDIMPAVKKVVWNIALEKTAKAHAADMVNRNYFSHISPEGVPAIQRSRQEGYAGLSIGEVIARNYTTVDEVIEGWKASESHCKAMMDAEFDEVGAGKTGTYWVMDLGRKN
ncbi:CAP domain-containing protein [Pedobacter rhodius]|uniref:CAP domain-containing protein n=1 Tax=Pedobacter rhodius TaxID=3004098 RepID=A0ABT4L2S5_9SPHI|nr:CAP domain-containing protein [Pedobacter sp. SJ11]MCZ4225370.1 CAP domain-containing protein [Pedobacter sp. SJ11]